MLRRQQESVLSASATPVGKQESLDRPALLALEDCASKDAQDATAAHSQVSTEQALQHTQVKPGEAAAQGVFSLVATKESPEAVSSPQEPAQSTPPGCAWVHEKARPKSRFPGAALNDLVCLELLAGSCHLSSSLAAAGFQAIAVDSRECSAFRVLRLDLLQASSRELVLDLLVHRKVFTFTVRHHAQQAVRQEVSR